MARRFNDEPINLIRRIPSPEQLEAARPTKPTFGQMLSQKGAAFVRSAMEAFASPRPTDRHADSQGQDDGGASHDRCNEERAYLAESECRPEEVQPHAQHSTAPSHSAQGAMSPAQSVSGDSGVSYEVEIGELRSFLLRQQQDIVHLAAQIHELKAIVQSQQQVLQCLERESEVTSVSFREERVASAASKGNALIRIRQKPVTKEKAMAEKENPTRASIN